jgi:hypothetical protein
MFRKYFLNVAQLSQMSQNGQNRLKYGGPAMEFRGGSEIAMCAFPALSRRYGNAKIVQKTACTLRKRKERSGQQDVVDEAGRADFRCK